jgi:DNA-binding LytR/AlgR family response regulator
VHRGSIVNAHVIDRAVREGPEKLTLYIEGSSERLAVSRQYFHLFKQT